MGVQSRPKSEPRQVCLAVEPNGVQLRTFADCLLPYGRSYETSYLSSNLTLTGYLGSLIYMYRPRRENVCGIPHKIWLHAVRLHCPNTHSLPLSIVPQPLEFMPPYSVPVKLLEEKSMANAVKGFAQINHG